MNTERLVEMSMHQSALLDALRVPKPAKRALSKTLTRVQLTIRDRERIWSPLDVARMVEVAECLAVDDAEGVAAIIAAAIAPHRLKRSRDKHENAIRNGAKLLLEAAREDVV